MGSKGYFIICIYIIWTMLKTKVIFIVILLSINYIALSHEKHHSLIRLEYDTVTNQAEVKIKIKDHDFSHLKSLLQMSNSSLEEYMHETCVFICSADTLTLKNITANKEGEAFWISSVFEKTENCSEIQVSIPFLMDIFPQHIIFFYFIVNDTENVKILDVENHNITFKFEG